MGEHSSARWSPKWWARSSWCPSAPGPWSRFDADAAVNVVAIALAFGFAVLIAVYAFGHVSGAHINPTVTIAFAAVRRFPWRAVPVYLLAQIAAGIFVTLNVSGGSFNAARSLGPMIIAGEFPGWWVYLIAPALGGVLGAFCYDHLTRRGAPPA